MIRKTFLNLTKIEYLAFYLWYISWFLIIFLPIFLGVYFMWEIGLLSFFLFLFVCAWSGYILDVDGDRCKNFDKKENLKQKEETTEFSFIEF